MKKYILAQALALLAINAYSSEGNKLLILEEIQKSIQKDFNLKAKTKTVTKTEEVVTKKKSTRGENKVQELLKKNRDKIKQMQKNEQIKEKTSQESKSANSDDWMKSKIDQTNNWQKDSVSKVAKWEEEKKQIIAQWTKDRVRFNKEIPTYKKNLVKLDEALKEELLIPAVQRENITTTMEVPMPVFDDYQIIDNAFEFNVKDQGRRPTCAAFAGTRALEIVLSRKEPYKELSEQYFFWSSKPKCQKSPCKKQGSWVATGYSVSKRSSSPNIPLEKDCSYNKKEKSNNSTQIPLSRGCDRGYAKVTSYQTVKSMPEIITALKDNKPVVGGFKLSKNFYKNTGYVFMDGVQTGGKLDSHAAGHAILLVGHMKLPKELHRSEGRFCLIAANSWGLGWGQGGHACLSEKWIENYRYDMPFIAVSDVTSK